MAKFSFKVFHPDFREWGDRLDSERRMQARKKKKDPDGYFHKKEKGKESA